MSNSSQCPPPPPLTNEEVGAASAEIAESMGVQSCKQDTDTMTAEMQMKAESFLGSVTGGGKVTTNNTSIVGCEQLFLSAQKIKEKQQSINCTLKKNSVKSTITLTSNNSIEFKSEEGSINIDCAKDFKLRQTMNINMVSLVDITSQDKDEIAEQTKAVVSEIAKTINDSETGFGATPQGQKVIQDVNKDIQSLDFKQLVNESITDLSIGLNQNNDIKLTSKKDLNIRGSNCSIDQDIVVNFVSNSIIKSVSEKALSSVKDTLQQYERENALSSANEGAIGLSELKLLDTNYADTVRASGEAVSDAGKGLGEGAGSAFKGLGEGIGVAAKGVGSGVGMAFAGPVLMIVAVIGIIGFAAYKMMGTEGGAAIAKSISGKIDRS